jgi:signal transduction histidine kinase
MSNVDSLNIIRPIWIDRVCSRLARGDGIRASFQEQLEVFYDKLIQSLDSGNPSWLESVIDEWARNQTVTDLEKNETTLPPILEQIILITFEVSREKLLSQQALELVGALLPVYIYLLEYAAKAETEQHIIHISQEMEKSRETSANLDKSKSDFIAIAAHELKTPLTLIEGYAAMLLEQLYTNPGQAEIMLKGIDNGTRRLREIVDDMIDVSLIDNNLLSLNFQPVWLNRLFDVIRQEIQDTLLQRRLRYIVNTFPGHDEMFFADGERLFQALRNVVLNAIKYTPDGGEVIVNGRRLPGFVEVIVTDTGIGIDPEFHVAIFEKFGRLGNVSLHSSSKTKYKGGGPGLGLPIAKGIIQAHGGTIWVESEGFDEVNCPGATFHILIPERKEPPDDKIAKLFRDPASIDQPQNILIDAPRRR